jgi:hypothetical protein
MTAGPDVDGDVAAEVTVVVPAWGAYAQYLPDALASLAAQHPQPSIVVVDNASVPTLLAHPGRIRVVRTGRRLSMGAARNAGLDAVATPYVLFWDVDDLMYPGTVDALLTTIRSDPGVVAVCASIVEDSGRPHHWPRALTARMAKWPRLFMALHVVSSLFPTTGAVLMRTDALRGSGGFPDVDGGDDWVAGLSLAARGRVTFISRPGRLYRLHSGSVSHAWTVRNHVLHARQVRRRLRTDPATPAIMRRAVPALAVGQWLVVYAIGPLRRVLSNRLGSRSGAVSGATRTDLVSALTAPVFDSGCEFAGDSRKPGEQQQAGRGR